MIIACRFLLLVVLALAAPARAADVVYPPGSRVGLVPPPGTITSSAFAGFEDRDRNVAIVIVALPPEAYGELEKTTSQAALKRQGITLEKREALTPPLGKAFLVTGRHEVDKIKFRRWILVVSARELTALVTAQIPETARSAYPDAAVRAALTSVAIRAQVPVEEQLGLLPFKVGELAGFRIGGLMAGRAIMLTDAAEDATGAGVEPHMVIAIAPGGPAQGANRDVFAREVFLTIPNLRDVRFDTSEPLRIGGQPGHQIMAQGKDNATGAEITVVQWLRFGGGAYLHLIGVAPIAGWIPAYARFRQVRDGIELR